MISREDVETAIRDLDMFVEEIGDAPMGGKHAARVEWERARHWLRYELQNRKEAP